ncbi:Hypothetical protein PHPALM_304 [Phytophthora palmivora]|uniref:Uncharacterized protein n=1 Tax=Phytophthora palmivora TaxID=4796 RepID=A0A2P4YV76_9STRA|nr:Hypothetical protein PHPALM_304 [Phytophthora palmivora]
MSAFQWLYGSGCNQSLNTLTGFHHAVFFYFLVRFEPLYNYYSPWAILKIHLPEIRRGHPRSMNADQCLTLELSWGRSEGTTSFLSLAFNVITSVMSLFLRFGRRLLVKLLKADSKVQVMLPTPTDVKELQDAINVKYPLLSFLYAVMDGLKLCLEASSRSEIQNMFYNGWTHDRFVSSVLAFCLKD